MLAKGPYFMELFPFLSFQILPFLKMFVTYFSGTKKLENWKFVYTWTMTECIVYTGIVAKGP